MKVDESAVPSSQAGELSVIQEADTMFVLIEEGHIETFKLVHATIIILSNLSSLVLSRGVLK